MFKTILPCLFLLLFIACSPADSKLQPELIQHVISVDEHPITVWEKSHPNATESILLVHGRTWSALPDFDLQVEGEDLSLMDGLVAKGYAVYAIDLRGYGATPRDETGWLTPNRSAKDITEILKWQAAQKEWAVPPHLFGWSMGSTLSHLAVQGNPELVASLTLFGYWRDSDTTFPIEEEPAPTPARSATTAEAAASDFIVPGSISQKAIDTYVKQALAADPIRVDLRHYDHFNELDPSKMSVPTLILQGEFDPIGPTETQAKLFTRLGTAHKQWVVIKGGDHAAFMETPRSYFIHSLVNFLKGVSID